MRPRCRYVSQCAAPTRPRLVVITITPFAASVPYSVEADGPFTTSTLSIWFGSMSLRRLGFDPPIPMLDDPVALSIRLPSIITIGSLLIDRLFTQRILML